MAIRDTMRRSSERLLHPGEVVESVFAAQTQSNYLIAVGVVPFLLTNRYRIVLATTHRILILDAGRFTMGTARGVVAELPRATRFAPPTGLWHRMELPGQPLLRVHKRFHKDIRECNDALDRRGGG